MSEFTNLTGKKFNSITVVKRIENKHRKARWECICDCGNKMILYTSDFSESRNVKSCRACFMKTFVTHGMKGSRIYSCWLDMKARCYTKKNIGYKNYGGRGISVCDEWRYSFDNFYKDMGDPPTNKHTIERDNVNGNYCKSNCSWATKKEQGRNKRNNILITINGEEKCLSEWCELYSIKYLLAMRRIKSGWPSYEALTTPSLGQSRGAETNNYKKRFINESL